MPPSSLKTLRDAIKSGSFDHAYYITGEDEFQKEDAIRQLIQAALDPAAADFNLDIRRAGDLDPESLGVLLGTPPMMAERRVVALRDVGGLRKEAQKVLEGYLRSPAPDLLLIMQVPAGAKEDSTLSGLSTPLAFDALSGDRIPKWITHQATTAHNVTVTSSASELLQAAVGNDLYQLAG